MSSSARILVIDNDPAESGSLNKKLAARGYENIDVNGNMDALDQVISSRPDVVILSASDNAGATLNLARAIKGRNDTASVPVILITQSDSDAARAEGLRAGADACLPFPYQDLQLFGRIDSLARLGAMQEELRRRTHTASKYGLSLPAPAASGNAAEGDANFLLVGPSGDNFEIIERSLCNLGSLTHSQNPALGITYLERRRFDAILLNIPPGQEAAYYLFAEDVRRNSRLFNIPIICLMDSAAPADQSAPYAAGAADVFGHPINIEDFGTRVKVLVSQTRYRDSLIQVYRQANDVAVSDALTGLYSHGFLMEHLSGVVAEAHSQHRSLTLGVFNLDNLPDINHELGYAIGDKILRQVGLVISNLVRGEDLSARFSGRRFALVMPETRLIPGEHVAHRIGSVINYTEIMEGNSSVPIRARISTGVAGLTPGMTAEALIKTAIANSK